MPTLLKFEQKLHPAVEAAELSEMKKLCPASQHEYEAVEGLHPDLHASAMH
jgi:hypothetical protein